VMKTRRKVIVTDNHSIWKAIQGATKYPVRNGLKICSCCGESKQVDTDFYKQRSSYGKYYYRGECKPCLNRIHSRKEREKRMEEYPNSYRYCSSEECNWIYGVQHKKCNKCGEKAK